MKICYIYFITNKINNKKYIGSTVKKEKREYQHFWNLENNHHHSIKLQNAINKYGIVNFIFEIVEEFEILNIKEQFQKEQEYLDKYLPHIYGYNMSGNAFTPGASIEWTEEMREKMGKKVSQKHKGKIPKNLKVNQQLQKRPILEYDNDILIREYESAIEAGRVLNIDYKTINNILTGKTKSCRLFPNKTWKYKDKKNTRKITSNKNSAWKKDKCKSVVMLDLEDNLIKTFECADYAVEELKISANQIRNNCNGNTKVCKSKNCKFKWLTDYENN